jgi:uncharacterized membrane protein
MSITGRCKRYFFRGLAVLLPTMLTIWILAWGYGVVRDNIACYINQGLVALILHLQGPNGPDETRLKEIFVTGYAGSAVGILIALVIVLLVGALLASVAGKALWRIIEGFIMSTPILRRVYPYVKQVTDFLFSEEDDQKKMFSRVVAVEYPRKGVWSVGFVTGAGFRRITEGARKELLTVMIPTSPTPVTGYVIVVPKEDTITLDLTIEEAFRFIVSAGVVVPASELPPLSLPAHGAAPRVAGAVELTGTID